MEGNKNQDQYTGNTLEYDYTKNVTIEVNVSYIEALQRITRFFITDVIEDPEIIPPMFAKFNNILKEGKITEGNELSEIDKIMYTLYTLQLDLLTVAKKQGYVKDVERQTSKEDMLSNLEDLMKKVDPSAKDVDMEKVEKLYSMLKK